MDAAVPDAQVAMADSDDADLDADHVLDALLPDAAEDAATDIQEDQPDALSEAATDASVDTGPVCPSSLGGVCSATELLFLEHDPTGACYRCLTENSCLDSAAECTTGNECDDQVGADDAGAGSGVPNAQLCLLLLSCILSSGCVVGGNVSFCACNNVGSPVAACTPQKRKLPRTRHRRSTHASISRGTHLAAWPIRSFICASLTAARRAS